MEHVIWWGISFFLSLFFLASAFPLYFSFIVLCMWYACVSLYCVVYVYVPVCSCMLTYVCAVYVVATN